MKSVFGRLNARSRSLRAAPWVVLVACLGVAIPLAHVAPNLTGPWLTFAEALFFGSLLFRMAVVRSYHRDRRWSLRILTLGLVAHAVGSVMLNLGGSVTAPNPAFPVDGEYFFLAAYIAIGAYILMDIGHRHHVAKMRWLEALIVVGGCACVAGAIVITMTLTVQSKQHHDAGLSVLLSLLYPMIDIMLALVVATQVAVRFRAPSDAVAPIAAFALFAIADTGIAMRLPLGVNGMADPSLILWGVGLALIAGNASRRRTVITGLASPNGLAVPLVASGLAAALVLAFEPDHMIRTYIVGPALATLLATGARLVLALRAATKAADAFSLSRIDDLTELPNRRAMLALVEERLSTTAKLGVMIIDLDGFKEINDTLGHAAGDAILRGIATRVRSAVDPSVMFARLGGDEFAVVAPTENEIEMMELANLLLIEIRQQFVIDGISLTVDASMGITTRQATDTSSGELLRRADVAMYEAKEGRTNIALYDPDTDEFSRERLSLADELRRALDDNQLVLWYQLQLDAATGLICGFEGLVRWQHPTRGLLSPGEFLPVARRCGLMQALSDEIARIAVHDLVRWRDAGAHPKIAINIAAPELLSGIMVPRLSTLLDVNNVSTQQVLLEVTEDLFLADPERARAELLRIKSFGFEISIDDYGSGFSSLSYLRDLPISELKLDRSFVTNACSDAKTQMIAASTLRMAAALGLRSVVEGIEDAATAAEFVRLGADVLQGFHLSRPVPPEQVPDLLRTYRAVRYAEIDYSSNADSVEAAAS